jgi:4-hydroxy-tetrahydrodipicolinate synthase
MKLEGALTALVTPMRDGEVDYDALDALVDWQIAEGIDGIVSVGTTGESATLSVPEHVEVIRHTVKIARKRVPVVAGAGANSTAEALELTKASEDAGADALLHVAPYYNRPTQEGLYRHFEAIAKSTRLPILLYNVPTRTSCDLLPETVERLARIDNIVGIKEATGSLTRATDIIARCGERFTVLSGDDGTCFPLYAIGARGVISVVSNIVPRRMAEMWDAAAAGNWPRARELHYAIHALNILLFAESSPSPTKAALALMGRCGPEVRLPMCPVTEGLLDRLRVQLKTEGLL